MKRAARIHHCTSEPMRLFGRGRELALLDEAVTSAGASLLALVGPGGQGKTAIVQQWLRRPPAGLDGLFFWSFYRGMDADLCLREWAGYAEGLDGPPEASASWCVERILRRLRAERWAVILDGAEVVQHEEGPWAGRFVHPDLGWLLEEVASSETPGTVVVTTRFGLPTLERRSHARVVRLGRLDAEGARALLESLGVTGAVDEAAASVGRHAKAVELLGTFLARFRGGDAGQAPAGAEEDEEAAAGRALRLFQEALPAEEQDLLALATAFREPPTEELLLDYLESEAVARLAAEKWGRDYEPFGRRGRGWLAGRVEELVRLRLLERVGPGAVPVVDAHPLVRRGFERGSAGARAGFLRGRPGRRRPQTLEEARPVVELFHAACDAGLWDEADGAFVFLENPKHRLLAPALERDLLRRFFPAGDWTRPPLWPGFGRWRSLAIALEMLGDFEGALGAYRPADAALRGDALLALGRAAEVAYVPHAAAPWQGLWQAYRCHALVLLGRVAEGVALARSLVPVDVYEWAHVFECLLRAGALASVDERSLAPLGGEHAWAALARRRMLLDLRRIRGEDVRDALREVCEEYDRAGLPVERVLARLSLAACGEVGALEGAPEVPGLMPDVWAHRGRPEEEAWWRERTGLRGPVRP